jgi:hypothetical protein
VGKHWGDRGDAACGRGREPDETAEETGFRAAEGKTQPVTTGGFLHPYSDLEQAKPPRRALRTGEIADGRESLAH